MYIIFNDWNFMHVVGKSVSWKKKRGRSGSSPQLVEGEKFDRPGGKEEGEAAHGGGEPIGESRLLERVKNSTGLF